MSTFWTPWIDPQNAQYLFANLFDISLINADYIDPKVTIHSLMAYIARGAFKIGGHSEVCDIAWVNPRLQLNAS
jgi:hypothetical protein